MATYKVIQDIEAEDKLIGPLTLKQFIYAIIVIVMGFVAFRLGAVKWYLALPFLPPMLLFGVLAAPFGRDQSTEVWLLAKIRFSLKPRRRIWDQTGMQELVTITAPKRPEQHLTNDLSETEVKSRLRALANTIDSRGWAIKNVNVNLFAQPAYALGTAASDRLIDPSVLPNEVTNVSDVQAADDMLDMQNNPVAQQLNSLIAKSAQTHRKEALQHMADIKAGGSGALAPITSTHQDPNDMWFVSDQRMNSHTSPATFSTQAIDDNDDDTTSLPAYARKKSGKNLDKEDKKLLDKVHKDKDRKKHHKKYHEFVSPDEKKPETDEEADEKPKAQTAPASMTPTPDPAIINYANRDDLTVSTIARQLQKEGKSGEGDSSEDEVVISLR